MYNVIIIGAGNFGREVLSWLYRDISHERSFFHNEVPLGPRRTFKGFLDSRPNILNNYNYHNEKIICSVEDYEPKKDDVFICAIGNPVVKAKLIKTIEERGGLFINLIHHSTIKGNNVKIANSGVIICPGCVISCDAEISSYVTLNIMCAIGHDVKIGKYSQLSSHINLTGKVSLGEGVMVNSNACIIPEVSVGDWATIGAGSVVLKDVSPYETVFGNPARVISKQQKQI